MALGKLLQPVSVNMFLFSHLKLLYRTEVQLQPPLLAPTGVKQNKTLCKQSNKCVKKTSTDTKKRNHKTKM